MSTQFACAICLFGYVSHHSEICKGCLYDFPPVNENGYPITFSNTFDTGFLSIVNGLYGTDRICFVNGLRCYANETNAGDVAIQLLCNDMIANDDSDENDNEDMPDLVNSEISDTFSPLPLSWANFLPSLIGNPYYVEDTFEDLPLLR